jgi:hypothetical protein
MQANPSVCEQKEPAAGLGAVSADEPSGKSFLVLFFKKEPLSAPQTDPIA